MARRVDLSSDGSRIELSFPFDLDLKDRLRAALPAARWDRNRRRWVVPMRWGSCQGLMGWIASERAGGDFVFGEGVEAAFAALDAEHAGRLEASRAEAVESFPRERIPVGLSLRPYQEAGVLYALKAERTFIADDMGLGKTVEASTVLWLADARPAVIVCPPAVVLNWRRELRTWCPGWTVTVLKGRSSNQAYHADVVVLNWQILADHVKALKAERPAGVVFDESHWAKSSTSARGKAAAALASRARYVLNLTGTAAENRPDELVHQLRVLRRLQDFGGSTFFRMRYCGPSEKEIWRWNPATRRREMRVVQEYKGASNVDELNRKLRSICYVRREKSVVLGELPEKQRSIVDLEIDNRAEYLRAKTQTADWLRAQGRSVPKSLGMSKIDALKRVAALGKLAGAVGWASEFGEAREKLILFAFHVDVQTALADALEAKGYGVVRLVGGMSAESRLQVVDRFQTDPTVLFAVASLSAWREGWTGTAASNVAFVEFDWTPERHNQAEDRANRFGQKNAVTAWYLRGVGTIDEETIEMLEQKRAVTTAVNIGGDAGDAGAIFAGLVDRLTGRRPVDVV